MKANNSQRQRYFRIWTANQNQRTCTRNAGSGRI